MESSPLLSAEDLTQESLRSTSDEPPCPLTAQDLVEFLRSFKKAKKAAQLDDVIWENNSAVHAVRGGGGLDSLYDLWCRLAEVTAEVALPFITKHPSFKLADVDMATIYGEAFAGVVAPALNFRGAKMRQVALQGAFLPMCNLDGAHLQEGNFNGAFIHGGSMKSMKCDYVFFDHALIEYTALTNSSFNVCSFRYAYTEAVALHGCSFHDVAMTGAYMNGNSWDPIPRLPVRDLPSATSSTFTELPDGQGLEGNVSDKVQRFVDGIEKSLDIRTCYSSRGAFTSLKQMLFAQRIRMAHDMFDLEEITEFIAKLQMSVNRTSWLEVLDFFHCLRDLGVKTQGELSSSMVGAIFESDDLRSDCGLAELLKDIAQSDDPPEAVVCSMRRAAGYVKRVACILRNRLNEEQVEIQRIIALQDWKQRLIASGFLAILVAVFNFIANYVFERYILPTIQPDLPDDYA